MNDDLQSIWIFGSNGPLAIAVLLQILDLGLTLMHSLQERRGQLWRYFGAIAGVEIPDGFGLLTFFGGLTVSLWIVGLLAVSGTVFWQTPLAFGCLGAIIGCRVSDSWFSHIALDRAGYRPNPGLPSVKYYLGEAVVLLVVFYPALRAHTLPAVIGFVIGVLAFYSVIPVLRLIGPLIFPRIPAWQGGAPQPTW